MIKRWKQTEIKMFLCSCVDWVEFPDTKNFWSNIYWNSHWNYFASTLRTKISKDSGKQSLQQRYQTVSYEVIQTSLSTHLQVLLWWVPRFIESGFQKERKQTSQIASGLRELPKMSTCYSYCGSFLKFSYRQIFFLHWVRFVGRNAGKKFYGWE